MKQDLPAAPPPDVDDRRDPTRTGDLEPTGTGALEQDSAALTSSATRAAGLSWLSSLPVIHIIQPWTHRASIVPRSHCELVAFAQFYATRGWPVFPVVPAKFDGGGGKNPRIKNWQQLATLDQDQILRWWDEMPTSNIGVLCGPRSGLLVVDLDYKPDRGIDGHESLASLAAKHGSVPAGPRVRRGMSSTHAYFAYDERLGNSVGNIPGVDVRAAGGFVVGAGSFHAASGDRYDWLAGTAELPLPTIPDWLVEALIKPRPTKPRKRGAAGPLATRANVSPPRISSAYAAAALRAEVENVAQAEEGTRNSTLNAAAFSLGTLVGAGAIDRDVVEEALAEAAAECGLDEDEAERTIASGLAAGELAPRELSKPKSCQPVDCPRSKGLETDVDEDLP